MDRKPVTVRAWASWSGIVATVLSALVLAVVLTQVSRLDRAGALDPTTRDFDLAALRTTTDLNDLAEVVSSYRGALALGRPRSEVAALRAEVDARLRPRDANPVAYAGLHIAELQRKAYSDIEPDLTTATPQEAYDAVLKVITKRKWHIVDARPPQGAAPRDGLIEAIARTPILSFRDDVAVRVRATPDGARIDVRSASRYGRHDLGVNAARVRALIEDVDDVLSAPATEKKQPAPKSTQAAGKGNSVKR